MTAGAPGAIPAHLAWAKGGHAAIRRVADDSVELCSTTPAPPGARLEATLAGDDGEPSVTVKIKSHGSRREADGTFALTGRLIDASRALRDRLAKLATFTAGGVV